MATAYAIRYGKAKVGFGPGVDAVVSMSRGFEGVVIVSLLSPSDTTVGGGGGSMTDGVGDGFTTGSMGSGNAGMGSSGEEVSRVMFLVTGGDCLRV